MPSRRHVFPGLALACTSRERLAAIDLRASGREGLPWRLTEATNGASGGIAGGPSTQVPFASRASV
ncbi:hypothetical protein [Phytopseudomonas dryadis]|uniref:Uncharacterized protein n=1 Tax=Phytopseudomonas dryadis TaxID=2487520 RepID=A0ABY1Z8L3_9GAMM|nr:MULTISPECIES: hypothetical protein [Pseudomonas]TBV07693.1 hypothetical protein DNK34_08290 [Pseudomonas dryadis]TBV19879.1 hypothetical protein DNK41_00060 [Pseudomonas sp. FRB 230]